MSSRGKFITLEGPEGSGKSTHAEVLVERIMSAGHQVIVARDPGTTDAGEAIRDLLKQDLGNEPLCRETELFLFLAARAQLVRQVILPALKKGVHVVCDRFADSTTAYQGYGRKCDLKNLLKMNDFAVQGLVPDITILLDIDVSDGLKRVERRGAGTGSEKDRIEREEQAFHERVRAGYLDLARRWPDRFRRVDTSRPIDEVKDEVWREVRRVIEG
ncbi:dTMP kinase [Verrucomicrobiota bacterium]